VKILIILLWSFTISANTDGAYDTFRSFCSPINLKVKRLVTTISFFQKSLVSKRIPFKATFVENEEGVIVKAPIVFIIPGSFAEIEDDQAMNMLNLLNNQGLHAVIFPHPWSPTIVQARINYNPGDLEKESSLMVEMINFVTTNYGKYISPDQVSLMGISSGATLALALAAKNQKKELTTKFNKIVLMSPPIDLDHSINVVDQMYAEVDSLARSLNGVSLFKGYKGICSSYRVEDYREVPQYPYYLKLSKVILAYYLFVREFQKMVNNLEAYDDFSRPNSYDGFITEKLLRFPTKFSIGKTYQKMFPNTYLDMKNRTGKLSYWLPLVENVIIIASDNDPINDGISWNGVQNLADKFIIVKNGGHFGFRNEMIPKIFPGQAL
jgi:pimeloyl-ACP methyl ester carboxylesterase